MCQLTIKCDKCKRAINSMKWKVKRNKNALKKITKKVNLELHNKLLGEIDGVEWCIRKLEQQCDCEVVNINS